MTPSEELKISFCFFDFRDADGPLSCRPEPITKADDDGFDVLFENNEEFQGKFSIFYQGAEAIINDDIFSLTRNMCFRSMDKLVLRNEVRLMYFTTGGYINMTPENEWMIISGDHFATIRVPYRAFIESIFALGVRFKAFFERLAPKSEENNALLQLLKEDEAAAKLVLESHKH